MIEADPVSDSLLPTWSPSGERLAFIAAPDTRTGVQVWITDIYFGFRLTRFGGP